MPTKASPLLISDADRDELSRWLRSGNLPQKLVFRARLILQLAEGLPVTTVAERNETSRKTVHEWKNRFMAEGIAGLNDLPRPGRPTVISEKAVQEVLRMTVEERPHESTHWSVRLMAKYAGLTMWQVRQIWDSADLRPHRIKTFKISNDPKFADKVVDIVGLYLNPPDNALVLSVDEKTQIQALDRTQPGLPLRPGQVERRTHDYKRHGTASLYAALNLASGQVIAEVTDQHRAVEFLKFLRKIDRSTPSKLDLHLILDNSSTHKTAEVQEWLQQHPRFKLHFTPTSASWINAVEGWFSQLERRALQRGAFTSVQELKDELKRFVGVHNEHLAKPFTWTKSADAILQAVERAKNATPN